MPTNPRSRPDAADLDFQIDYFATRRPVRMLAADTPYVRRHHAEVMAAGGLQPGERVCEWGAGLGRFTRLLLADGLRVDAIELSPEQTRETAAALAGAEGLAMHNGDIVDVVPTLRGPFDAMVGYFMLHHLPELPRYFRSAHAALRPGGRMVFVEPNPYHPLYPVQITLTPGMRWRAERGIYQLTPGSIQRAAAEAGFSRVAIGRYGSIPRAPYNWLARWNRERFPERLVPTAMKPFQTIVAWR